MTKQNAHFMIALAVLFSSTLLMRSGATQARDDMDDQVTIAVEQEFLRDDVVPFSRVDVRTTDGVVMLTGTVSNLTARLQAERRAAVVRGVRGIVNRIEVTAPKRPAAELIAAAQTALADDPATDEYEVHVSADERGEITLTGAVDSYAERLLVDTVVMTVEGVSAVVNQLTVKPPAVFGNEAEITDHVRGLLRWDARVNDVLVNVRVLEGSRVQVSGTVGSLAEKSLIEQLAWVSGVRSVDVDHLNVEPWAQDKDLRLGERTNVSDNEIRDALLTALAYDPRVLSTPVEVRVDNGTVWLLGSVDNLPAKRAAERDAYNTVGVRSVSSLLRVRPEVLTDSAIAELISNGLKSRHSLADNDIRATVNDGQARLTGDVDTSLEYQHADDIAGAARGVEALDNDLTVRGSTPLVSAYPYGTIPKILQAPMLARMTDREIFDGIRSELFWSPFVSTDSVHVDVDDGVVTLTGAVSSLRERRFAVENALEGGALTVRDDLTIDD